MYDVLHSRFCFVLLDSPFSLSKAVYWIAPLVECESHVPKVPGSNPTYYSSHLNCIVQNMTLLIQTSAMFRQ